jgi:anti-sigma B factor antagonist
MRPPMVREENGVLVLTLDDPDAINDGQSIALRQPIYQAVQEREAPQLVVDLKAIDFLSSSGVALLIGLKRRVEGKGGKLVLFNLHPHVLDLFKVMKLTSLFALAEDEAHALAVLPSLPTE